MAEFSFIEQQTIFKRNEDGSFVCSENGKLVKDDEKIKELKGLNLCFEAKEKEVKYLGLNPYDFSASYYIGIDWLKEKEYYIAVNPKIENLDYVKMFVHCLEHREISEFVSEIYNVDLKRERIEVKSANFNLTPFMIAHFLFLVENIVKKGLKSNYIIQEENLSSKIKGKIIFSQQIKKNIVAKRDDRIFCRYQEYNKNCLENRLLKKALLFIKQYSKYFKEKYPKLNKQLNSVLSAFEMVSDDISYSEIKRIKVSALYKEYNEAIELAKNILKYFGYSFTNAGKKEKSFPPFWIDMSKLFELYVYSLLKDQYRKEISYQSNGNYGNVDFLKIDDKLIIDTKYKLVYKANEEKGKYNIDDIRQLSGYARDKSVLRKLNIVDDNIVVDCVIIYPDENKSADFQERKLNEDKEENKISQFTKFYKCGIKLPIFNQN